MDRTPTDKAKPVEWPEAEIWLCVQKKEECQ